MAKFKTHEHDGKEYSIEINDAGEFCTTIDKEEVRAESFEALKTKISRLTRRAAVRIAIDATYVDRPSRWTDENYTLVDVIVTGIHARNRSILLRRLDNNKSDVFDNHGNEYLFTRLSEKEKDRYKALVVEKKRAEKALEEFRTKYRLDKNLIATKVAAAEKAAGIEPGDDRD